MGRAASRWCPDGRTPEGDAARRGWHKVLMDPRYQSYIDGFRLRSARAQSEARERTEAARALLLEAARLLRSSFGATRVGAFGSLVTSELAADSDIDLYVDTIARGRYWRAVAQLTALFGRPVDLIELDVAPPSLIETIEHEGVDVPEARALVRLAAELRRDLAVAGERLEGLRPRRE